MLDGDGRTYRTVVIGDQTWMAENLKYAVSYSQCGYLIGSDLSNTNTSTCDTYGRLYDWATAKKACPAGWHLPTNEEWMILVNFVGGIAIAGKRLKAKSGWDNGGNGTDDFGFAALPGGYGDIEGYFEDACEFGHWWSASENGVYAYSRGMGCDFDGAYWSKDAKSNLFSVRCLKD